MNWWNLMPIIAPLPKGFLDGDTSHKDAREWMKRASKLLDEAQAEILRLTQELEAAEAKGREAGRLEAAEFHEGLYERCVDKQSAAAKLHQASAILLRALKAPAIGSQGTEKGRG